MKVYMLQCLCPSRHCILAIALETDDLNEVQARTEDLRRAVASLIAVGTIDPWCGICHSRDWFYEAKLTKYKTMAEAKPAVAEAEAANARARNILGKHGRS